jgi:multisubunit Na+/H+ antiporter MnhE subunit
VRHVIGWLLGWLVLFWLWLLLAGEWNRQELVAAAAAASVAATLGEVARTLGRVRARIRRRRLVRAWSVPHQVFADFGLLLWALALSVVRREVVRGRFVARPFPAGGHDPYAVGLRAWISVTATYSPNAYVVELDPERKLVLLHDLIPSRASEKPA